VRIDQVHHSSRTGFKPVGFDFCSRTQFVRFGAKFKSKQA
jgi:hypothetical protein